MSTYKNCHELVRDVRLGIDEYDDALASGDDIVGGFSNDFIIEQINQATIELFGIIARRRPQELIKETPIVGVNSAYALPADFGKLVLFKDQYGQKIWNISQRERRMTDQTGSERCYYQRGRTLYLDATGLSTTCTLIYMPIPRRIHMSKAYAGSSLALTLDPKRRDSRNDYYNGMILEDVTGAWTSEITDYVGSTGVCTVTGTGAQHDLYGLVPELPEWAHHLIGPKAIILCKSHPKSKEVLGKPELDNYQAMLRSTLIQYASEADDDVDWDEMFTNYPPIVGGYSF